MLNGKVMGWLSLSKPQAPFAFVSTDITVVVIPTVGRNLFENIE